MDPDINTTVWIEKPTNKTNTQTQETGQKQEHSVNQQPDQTDQEHDRIQAQQKQEDQFNDHIDQENDQQDHNQHLHQTIQGNDWVRDQQKQTDRANDLIDQEHNQQDPNIESDPEVRFKVTPDISIPARVTRSKNNISKASTKYDKDFVKLLNNS